MNLLSYIEKGGPIMYLLLALNIIGYTIMIWKVIQLGLVRKRGASRIFDFIIKSIRNKKIPLQDEHVILALVRDELNGAMYKLETGLRTVKIIASIAPLLGLLGTVLGILSAFTSISQKGLSDPSLFAGGISLALITTVGGLIVAIPHNIGYNYIAQIVDQIEIKLEQDIFPTVFKVKENI